MTRSQLAALAVSWKAVAATFGLLSGCGSRPPPAPPVPEVIVDTVVKRDLPLALSTAARVAGSRVVEVRARVNGVVLERAYKEGQVVRKGDLLFRIDPRRYQAAYDRAAAQVRSDRANLDEARRQFDRVKTLAASGAASQREYDQATSMLAKSQAAVALSEAAEREAKLDLDYAAVRAPVAGIASKEAVTVGNTARAATCSPPSCRRTLRSRSSPSPRMNSFACANWPR
jgi:membrane fusion protein (multidrug efflux system)